MDIAELIGLTRTLSNVNAEQIDDTTLLQFLNIAYHRMENAIVDRVDEDYFRDIFTADTVE